ncbi:hypothetical protein [Peijinzhouia sedimentorum]
MYADTLLQSSRHYLKGGVALDDLKEKTVEEWLVLIDKCGREIALCIACAVLNDYRLIRLFKGIVATWLLRNLRWEYICLLLEYIILHNGTSDFMRTTRLAKTLKITEPNLGQKKKKTKGS